MASTRLTAAARRVKETRHPPSRPASRPRSRASRVLAERNPPVVAVGAWVEEGADLLLHPTVLALETERLLDERRRENQESLQRFRDGLRHRLAERAGGCGERQRRRRQQRPPPPRGDGAATPDRRTPQSQFAAWADDESESAAHPRTKEKNSQEAVGGTRRVRLRLAARRVIPHEDAASNLPGGEWSVGPNRHETEEDEDDDDGVLFTCPHDCPLVQQKPSGHSPWETDRTQPDQDFRSSPAPAPAAAAAAAATIPPPILWPLTGQEELKRQRQSEFSMHRRLAMNWEREQVKENKQHRKHLQRSARIKAEKEQVRLQEERRLEEARRLDEVQLRLQEREMLILERLRLEEEEREQEVQRRRQEKGKEATRFVEALRARMKERLSQMNVDLPPLCCCASTFWDSHPDTCANNCVFHNNPKAYAQALRSTMASLDLH
ncbi:unnamed protein product [Ophioblennius macclurei]